MTRWDTDWDGDPVVITMDSSDKSKLAIWIFVLVVGSMLLLALYGYLSGAWETLPEIAPGQAGERQ